VSVEPDESVSSGVEVSSPRSSYNTSSTLVFDDTGVIVGVIEAWSIVIDVFDQHCHRRRACQRSETYTPNNRRVNEGVSK